MEERKTYRERNLNLERKTKCLDLEMTERKLKV